MVSVWAKEQRGAIFPCSEVSGACAQAGQLLCLGPSASSYSFLPMLSLPGVAAEATAVPPVENSRNTRKGKLGHTPRFLPGRFKQEPGFSHSARGTLRCRVWDWGCNQGHLMNFSWRKMGFKCKKSRLTRENGGSAPS